MKWIEGLGGNLEIEGMCEVENGRGWGVVEGLWEEVK